MSALEDEMLAQIRLAGLPEPEREVLLVPGRRFRADFLWRERRLWLDVQGGQWVAGHHSRGSSVEGDAEKISLATIAGWRPLIATTSMVKSGKALELVERALTEAA